MHPFIALEYEDPMDVYKVIIYNRGDCCGDRLSNVRVVVTDELPGPYRDTQETVKGKSTYYILKCPLMIFPYQF